MMQAMWRRDLDEIVRAGAQQMLQAALQAEVQSFLHRMRGVMTADGTRALVGNGYLPERAVQTGVGELRVRQPRVRDRRPEGQRIGFSSHILPPYLRRAPSLEQAIPYFYLKGISTGDMAEALQALTGTPTKRVSPATVARLTQVWAEEYQAWVRRDLHTKHYVYWWADGIYFNVRLTPERPCLLVLIGALADGTKELVAVCDGERESAVSWHEVLRDLQARGLTQGPHLAIGDGALGFWHALEETFPGTAQQRCWVHTTANILDKLPKSVQPEAKRMIHEMYLSPTRAKAEAAYEHFVAAYRAKYPKAVACLTKDHEVLFTFYDFPAEHWAHLRTTNPIESTFGTVRHRTRQTKGCGSRQATILMVFKLATEAERHWRRLNGSMWLPRIINGERCVDGVFVEAA